MIKPLNGNVVLKKELKENKTASGIYLSQKQEEEDFFFAENKRIREEQGITDGEFYHYDTPCTIDNQIKLLTKAGFKTVRKEFREGSTTILVAEK